MLPVPMSIEDVTVDQLLLRPDGTAVVAFGECPVDPDDLSVDGPSFVPAWIVPRPNLRVMRHLTSFYEDAVRERESHLSTAQEAVAMKEAIERGDDIEEAKALEFIDGANRAVTALDEVLWRWWTEVTRTLARPIGVFPREVVMDDAPPWLLRRTDTYALLIDHWMYTPLARGVASGATARRPTGPQLVQ